MYKICKGITKAGKPCGNPIKGKKDYCCKSHAEREGVAWKQNKRKKRKEQELLKDWGIQETWTIKELLLTPIRLAHESERFNVWRIGYDKYLRSAHWKYVREQFRDILKTCRGCDANGILHVHHLNYKQLWKERWIDLTLLCEQCHNSLHDRD